MPAILMKTTYYDYNPALLIEARTSQGLTQERVAEDLKVTSVTISRVEMKRAASYEMVERLCKYYGLKPEGVIWEIENPPVHPSTKNFLRKST
jgi:transcriptional regulator with XRE-family HTH domain